MEKKHKLYLKINLTSLFFIIVSSISVTLAWFAYSGLASVGTEVGIKAWYIEFEKDNEKISSDIKIPISDIYPGMETVTETVNINNFGDSDAELKYSIVSARVLDELQEANNELLSSDIETSLLNDYPFHISINLSKQYVLAKGEPGTFEISISWPLDSQNDELDSLWGNRAYQFQQNEIAQNNLDDSYKIRPSIDIVLKLTAEQYVEE